MLSSTATANIDAEQAGLVDWHWTQHFGSDPVGAQPPSFSSMTARLPAAFGGNAIYFPTCTQQDVDGVAEFPDKCLQAVVGSGTATMKIGTVGAPLSNSITEQLNVRLVNRAPAGTGTLFVISSAPNQPIYIDNRAIPGTFTVGPDPYGTGVSFQIPEDLRSQLGLTLSLTDIDVTISGAGRGVIVNASPTVRSYLQLADCQGPLPFQASVDADTQPTSTVSTTGAVSCSVGGTFADYPINTEAPTVTGTPAPGEQLSCNPGTWAAPAPASFSYQWVRDGQTSGLPAGQTYLVTPDDVGSDLGCRVTASNSTGDTTASSATVHVLGAQADTNAPSITITTPAEGQHFAQGQSAGSSFSCSDGAGSGVANCSGAATIDTATVGAHEFTVDATDNAFNHSSKTVNYTVDAPPTTGGAGDGSGGSSSANTTPTDSASAPPPPTTPSGSGSSGPTTSAVLQALSSDLAPPAGFTKIGAVLGAGGVMETFDAPSAGDLVMQWFFVPPGATLAKAKPVLVASGKHSFATAGKAKIKLKLTLAGKRLLKKSKKLKLAAKGTFTPKGGKPASAVKRFALKR